MNNKIFSAEHFDDFLATLNLKGITQFDYFVNWGKVFKNISPIEKELNLLNTAIGKEDIKERLVILSDQEFTYFVRHSTEVVTRTKINNETGIAQDGSLHTVEYLNEDSVLYATIGISPLCSHLAWKDDNKVEKLNEFISEINDRYYVIGADKSLGKGLTNIRLLKEEGERNATT